MTSPVGAALFVKPLLISHVEFWFSFLSLLVFLIFKRTGVIYDLMASSSEIDDCNPIASPSLFFLSLDYTRAPWHRGRRAALVRSLHTRSRTLFFPSHFIRFGLFVFGSTVVLP